MTLRVKARSGSCYPHLLAVSVVAIATVFGLHLTSLAGQPIVEQARDLLEDGKISEAESLLQQVIENDADNGEAYLLLAKVCLYKQDHGKAIKYAERAIEIDGANSQYHLWLARAYLAKAMESNIINAFRYARKGKSQYEKAVELDSTNIDAMFELSMYLAVAPGLAGGDKDRSMELAHSIEAKDSLYGAYAWAGIWEHDGDLDKAEGALKTAVRIDTSSAYYARYALGYFYERHERLEEALGVFRDIVKLKPDAMTAIFRIGKIYLLMGENLEEAEACFKRYLEIPPRQNAPSWASAHWRLGMVYDLQGKLELAVTELRKAVELEPSNKEFRQTLREVEKKIEARSKQE